MDEFEYEVGIRLTVKNLKERIKIIESGIEAGVWKGEQLRTHKKRLTHYRYQLYWRMIEEWKERKSKRMKKKKRA